MSYNTDGVQADLITLRKWLFVCSDARLVSFDRDNGTDTSRVRRIAINVCTLLEAEPTQHLVFVSSQRQIGRWLDKAVDMTIGSSIRNRVSDFQHVGVDALGALIDGADTIRSVRLGNLFRAEHAVQSSALLGVVPSSAHQTFLRIELNDQSISDVVGTEMQPITSRRVRQLLAPDASLARGQQVRRSVRRLAMQR